jgi:hypothetical protein
MTKTEYKKYLQSPQWQQRRRDAIDNAGGICEKCLMPRWLAEIAYDQDLHVHHLTYANKGAELAEDLQVLCRRCHEIETFGRSELREIQPSTCELCDEFHYDRRDPYCTRCLSVMGITGHFSEVLNYNFGTTQSRTWVWEEVAGAVGRAIRAGIVPLEFISEVVRHASPPPRKVVLTEEDNDDIPF